MNNTWKLSILGAFALAASSAVMAIGCTVTTTSGPLGDGGADGSATTDGGGDSATIDSGGGEGGGGCTATAACPIIASNGGVSFDNPQCGTCDKCSATNCCAQVTKCFALVNGMKSDCESLFDCIIACAGDNACKAACKAAYTNDAGMNPTYDDLVAADDCQQGAACKTACGDQADAATTD